MREFGNRFERIVACCFGAVDRERYEQVIACG